MNLRKFFLENEAVEGINSTADYLYIKILRFTLDVIRSWPRKELGEPENLYFTVFMKYFYLILNIVTIMGSTSFIVVKGSELSFLEAGLMYLIFLIGLLDTLTVISLTFSEKYRVLAKDFLTQTHLFHYKDRSKYAMEIHRRIHFISHLFSLWMIFQMISGATLFNITPMYSNFAAGKYRKGGLQNSTFEHSLYYLYPFNTSTDVTGYTVACILHFIISYLCSIWFCMFNLLLALMVFNIWGHFKILIKTLEEFPRPTSKSCMYTQEESIEVAEKLKDCINYHREIKTFTNRISDIFGPMLFIYYSFHQASGCLVLLECSQMTGAALMRYLPLTIILTQQLIQLSVVFELLGSESERLKDAVYGVPWECMDIKNRKVVRFFLMNVQNPVQVKAMGLANVGVTTMASIMKTSMSYFTFLLSQTEEN
uniref:Odorant receptor n=2 Tax=Heliothis subflexa TaxID=38041 RepID=A0A8E4MSQ8_HELSB|nr:olfactory receptor OR6 [Heliothis subflexa]